MDPYFSATKLSWILDHVPGARRRAEKRELAFGTVDSFLLWHLTGGKVHKTDITNAARTMLFNLETNKWDQDLLNLFNIPMNILPEVCDNAHQFGETSLFGGSISIGGMAGDQQSALIGQCCFQEGEAKSTFGTGCFVLVNTGSKMVKSKNKLLSTVAYRLNGKTTFGLEGSIFIAGSAIQWLRDELKFFNNAQEVETVIKKASDTSNVMVIPAFTGLGAPFWDPEARGLIYGLTRDSGIPEITLATLQSVIYQTRSLLDAMKLDGAPISKLKVDGGMVINSWLNQELSNCLRLKVLVPKMVETTSLGAAYLAGLSAEIFPDLESLSSSWKLDKQYDFDQKLSERSNTNYERWLRVLNKLSL